MEPGRRRKRPRARRAMVTTAVWLCLGRPTFTACLPPERMVLRESVVVLETKQIMCEGAGTGMEGVAVLVFLGTFVALDRGAGTSAMALRGEMGDRLGSGGRRRGRWRGRSSDLTR
jgi:hypothetical protein